MKTERLPPPTKPQKEEEEKAEEEKLQNIGILCGCVGEESGEPFICPTLQESLCWLMTIMMKPFTRRSIPLEATRLHPDPYKLSASSETHKIFEEFALVGVALQKKKPQLHAQNKFAGSLFIRFLEKKKLSLFPLFLLLLFFIVPNLACAGV